MPIKVNSNVFISDEYVGEMILCINNSFVSIPIKITKEVKGDQISFSVIRELEGTFFPNLTLDEMKKAIEYNYVMLSNRRMLTSLQSTNSIKKLGTLLTPDENN